jgi:hypothetical protein
MDDLKNTMLEYAGQLSGYGSVLTEREEQIKQITERIEYLKQRPEKDFNLISILVLQLEDIKALPIARIHEANAPKNVELFNRYHRTIQLLGLLNNENKDWVEVQFKRLKRDHLKSKYKFV